MKNKVLRLTVIIVFLVIALFAISPNMTAPVQAQTWTQIWSDEFTGAAGSGVNTSNWIYDIGHCYPGCPAANWGTGEVEYNSNSTNNVYLDGAGDLVIKATIDQYWNWYSGRIETQRTDFAAPSGGVLAVEGRIQLPNRAGAAAQGYWPAFWMLGSAFRGVYTNWPGIGEIDILESVDGGNTVYGTMHCGVNPGGPCNETQGIGGNKTGMSPSIWGNWHTYRMELDKSVSPQQLRYYIDGVNYFTINSNQVDATTWNNTTNHGFFILLNVAMGGGWPGNPVNNSTSPDGMMLVDYVRVFTRSGTFQPPTNTPAPAPNLLTNPGFEAGSLSGWAGYGNTVAVNSSQRSGSWAAKQPGGSSVGFMQSKSGLLANTHYTFSCYLKAGDTSQTAYVFAKDFGAAEVDSTTTNSTTYTLKSVGFTTGATYTTATVGMWRWNGGSGDFFADDCSLTQG